MTEETNQVPLNPVLRGHGNLEPGGRAAGPDSIAALLPDPGPGLSHEQDHRDVGPRAGAIVAGWTRALTLARYHGCDKMAEFVDGGMTTIIAVRAAFG